MGNHSTKSQNISRDHRPKKNVHWKSAEPPSNPGKPIQVTDFNASGEALTIKWERPYTDGGSPIIGYLVEQRRVGSPSWVKTSATLIPYTELTLTGIDPTWRYQFRVFAQNVVGISEFSPISDPLSAITQRTGVSAPQFLNELQNTTVLENDQCEFHVSVIGSPTPQINWFKDGFEIFSSRRTKIINDHGSSTLIFHQVALTDEGEIKCTATNRYGHVVTRFQLKIDAPPKIRLPRQYEDGYLIEAGEVIKLKVGIAGRPTPAISWSHNGEMIINDGRCEITTNDKNSFLKIIKANRKDRGEYNVRAINKLGEFNASFLVTVTAKPSPPQNVRIAMSLGKSVTLTWNSPDDDGGCKIGNYVVEYFRIGWDVWLKASSTRQLTATLNDLIEGSEYKFRIKAESPYGLSEPSEESKILFIPDPKRGIVTPSSERSNRFIKQSTLSPQTDRRNMVDGQPRRSPIKQIVISDVPKNVEFISQIYDNEQIVKELNYGTSVDNRNKMKETIGNSIQNFNSYKPIGSNRSKENKPEPDSKPTAIKVTSQINSNKENRKLGNDENKLDHPAHDEAHTSNEYMLVLYDDKKTEKKKEEKNHFDLDLKEAIEEAPPLSLSTPDLHDMSHHDAFQPLRRSASSSELLYEKVMQRFYQAVELDEAEIARKRNARVNSDLNKRPKSVERTKEDNEFELPPDNEMKSYHEHEVHDYEEELENESDLSQDWVDENDRDLRREIIESQRKRSHTPHDPIPDAIYDDDYTESTASSGSNSMSASVESIEQFINSVRSATANTNANTQNVRTPANDELETYHPRMEVRALSPYRTPEPGQATVILNKPVPLPDPDVRPKSILKRRPSNENTINETTTSTVVEKKEIEKQSQLQIQQQLLQQKQEQHKQEQLRQEDLRQEQLKQEQKRQEQQRQELQRQELQRQELQRQEVQRQEVQRQELQRQEQQIQEQLKQEQLKQEQLKQQPKLPLPSTPKPEKEKRSFLNLFSKKTTSTENLKKPVEKPIEKKVPEKAVEREKLSKQRQNSLEENKVEQVAVIDHYSDIVKELGGKPHIKASMPLYMNHQAMRDAAARAEQEERELNEIEQLEQSLDVQKININEEEDAQYMLDVAKKMNLYTESIEDETTRTTPSPSNLVEISVEHTKSVSYAVRQIKQPDVGQNNETVFQASAKCLTESTKLCNDSDGNDSVIDTMKKETLTKVRSSSRSRQLGRKSISERRSQSKSPVSERKTSLSSTVLKVTRMPIENAVNDIDIDSEASGQSVTPEPQCTTTEQLQTQAELDDDDATLSYITDLALFSFACWLYIYHDARLAIPILILMVYRKVRDVYMSKMEKWTKRKRQ